MKIEQAQSGKEGSFYIADEAGNHVAEMLYNMQQENIMTIYHTEVADDLQGKDIGKQLVEAGVKFARANHYKIEPACSFAEMLFEREKDFADVLA